MTGDNLLAAPAARTFSVSFIPGAVLAVLVLVTPDFSPGAGRMVSTIPPSSLGASPVADTRTPSASMPVFGDEAQGLVQSKFNPVAKNTDTTSASRFSFFEPRVVISAIAGEAVLIDPPILSEFLPSKKISGTSATQVPERGGRRGAAPGLSAQYRETRQNIAAGLPAATEAAAFDPVALAADAAAASSPAYTKASLTTGGLAFPTNFQADFAPKAPSSRTPAQQFDGPSVEVGRGLGADAAFAAMPSFPQAPETNSPLLPQLSSTIGSADGTEFGSIAIVEEVRAVPRETASEAAGAGVTLAAAALPTGNFPRTSSMPADAASASFTKIRTEESKARDIRAFDADAPDGASRAAIDLAGIAVPPSQTTMARSGKPIGASAIEIERSTDVPPIATPPDKATTSFVPTLKTSSYSTRQVLINTFEQQGDIRSSLTTRVDGRVAGEVEFFQTEDSLSLKLASVISLLEGRMDPAEFARLKASSQSEKFLPLEAFQAAGVPISYDPVYDEFNIGSTKYRPSEAHKVQIDQVGKGTQSVEPIYIEQIPR